MTRGSEDSREPVKVLFVCLGNICRSPTAEAVMLHRVAEAGLADRFVIDSAGTSGWHVGDAPDDRSAAEARRRGIVMTSRGRQVSVGDLEYFDLVLAMDRANLTDLLDLAHHDDHRAKIRLFRSFDPALADAPDHEILRGALDVPDPYYGGPSGFADVFDLIDAACVGLLEALADQAGLGT